MLWKSIALDNYLPFTHSGIKHVSIDFKSPVTAFLGTNGSGKSSLLRALTPYSPVRTEFGQGGKVVKVIDHNGSIYELTSDFKNPGSPHSFRKDGVELNLSGTTETQKDLIEEHLGTSKLLEDIISGNIKICQISKAERKSLFSATYPGDLSFVLDYHKQISSMARACGNQLKLLKSREASIRSSLIDEAEITRLNKFKTAAIELINKIDKCLILLEKEITEWKQKIEINCLDTWSQKMNESGKDYVALGETIKKGIYAFHHVIRKMGFDGKLKSFKESDLFAEAARHESTSKNASIRAEEVKKELDSIKEELDKFMALKSAGVSESDKSNLESRHKAATEELSVISEILGSNQSAQIEELAIPVIENELIPLITRWIESFSYRCGSIMQWNDLQDLGVRIEHSKTVLSSEIVPSIENISEELAVVDSRLEKLESKSYPSSCKEVCQLRQTVESSIEFTRKTKEELLKKSESLIEKERELRKFIEENSPVYTEQLRIHEEIGRLSGLIRKYNVESIALNGEDLISCCNEHLTEIANRILKACEISKYVYRRDALKNEIAAIEATLKKLAEVKNLQMSAELIESVIKDREEKLNIGVEELIKLEETADHEKGLAEVFWFLSDRASAVFKNVEDVQVLLNYDRIQSIIEFDTQLVKDLEAAKYDVNSELFAVDTTLGNQKKYTDILESEILPTTEKIEKDKELYELIASGLSPTNGLPCIYLMRFINRLITRANKVINHVWMYGMELVYLTEGDNLDFNIQVRMRGSTLVKDLSELSLGQQAMVNLAMILAFYEEMNLSESFPLKLDEVDGGLTDEHRTRLSVMLSDLVDKGKVRQMFLVNHFAIQTGINHCDSVCLGTDGIIVPDVYNEHAIIN